MKIFRLSTIAVSITAIFGCGGGDDSTPSPIAAKSAGAVYHAELRDERLQDALVWLDTNNNYQQDTGEPNAYTNVEGKVVLDVSGISQQPEKYSLIALAKENYTINKSTGEKLAKSYLMVAPAGIKKISPVAHLLYSTQKSMGVSFEQAVVTTAELVGSVSEQQLRAYLTTHEDDSLQALSRSLMSVMPEGKTLLTQQKIIAFHPDLKSAVAAFNNINVDTNVVLPELIKTVSTSPVNSVSNVIPSRVTSDENQSPAGVSGNQISPQGTTQITNDSGAKKPQDLLQSNNDNFPTDSVKDASGLESNVSNDLNILPVQEVTREGALNDKTGGESTNNTHTETTTQSQALFQGLVADIALVVKTEAENQSETVLGSAQGHLSTIDSNGYWQDIVYSQPNTAIEHLKRMEIIAAAFQSTKEQKYKIIAVEALKNWITNKPVVMGWWAEFGEFNSLAKTSLLLGDDLPQELKSEVVGFFPNKLNTQKSGLNRIDGALANLYYGLLASDENAVGSSIQEISTIIEGLAVEGEQPDWSILLNTKLDSGKTGEELYYSLLNLVYNVNITLKDSVWKFSAPSAEILASILLDGIRWRDSLTHFGSKTAVSGDADSRTVISMDMVAALVPARKAETSQAASGFRLFGHTDSTVTLTDTFMFEIQMNTTSSELTNSGYVAFWSGLGGTSLSQSVEPYQNLTNVLGWSTIPGVTIPQYSTNPIYDGGTIPSSNFVGGATNGEVGVTTMAINMSEVRPSGSNVPSVKDGWVISSTDRYYVNAKKSWFSFGSQIAVLGAGINSNHSVPINTIVAREVFSEGQYQTSLGSFTPEKGRVINYDGADWLHHKNVGYVFHDNLQRNGSIFSHQADWPSESGQTTNTVKDIFTFWIPHGVGPTDSKYAYIMLPSATVEETKNYNQNQPLEILANTTQVQAVKDNRRNIISAVFFQPTQLVVSSDVTVDVDKPCVVILERITEDWKATVSTPGISNGEVTLTLTTISTNRTRKVATPMQVGNSVSFSL